MKTYALKTFGCRANQYDSGVLIQSLDQLGLKLVPFDDVADFYIINTCAITHQADAEARQFINRAKRTNPEAMALVTGCSAQIQPEMFSQMEGVHHVVGVDQRAKLIDLVKAELQKIPPRDDCGEASMEPSIYFGGGVRLPEHSRSFLKIQDGCSQFCTFCIVPFARGLNRSVHPEKIIMALHDLQDQGFREVVLTGIHLGTYGKDLKDRMNFYGLLKRIVDENLDLRIRLSSLDPEEVSDDLIDLLASSQQFCDHLHLPLQSGDNDILKKMHRRYTSEYFIELCHKLQSRLPQVCLGTDVIVGFPGESENAFNNTLETIKKAGVSHVHGFPYSIRKGTKAADFSDQVDPKVKKERMTALKVMSDKLRYEFNKRFLDQTLEVVLEQKSERPFGLTSNYISVEIHGKPDYVRQSITNIRISSVTPQGVYGNLA